MKITEDQLTSLENHAEVLDDTADGFGDPCPACGRPHVHTYEDGSKVCGKCDELVFEGAVLRADWKLRALGA
jgi:uncharacterized Zn finger protein (UPF0148 family)